VRRTQTVALVNGNPDMLPWLEHFFEGGPHEFGGLTDSGDRPLPPIGELSAVISNEGL
jgi:hypothetical protein